MIQALLDRIAALPEAEQYLATEPNMDDEEAYVEWEEKLYAYAGEALAIWEEYEALTDGQQAQFSEENVVKLTAWVEIAKTVRESAQVMAADSGTRGDNVTWELDADGVLKIRGSGAMQDFEDKQSPFYNKNTIKKVIVADGVTSIGEQAFSTCMSLKEVTIPDSVKSIGALAFYACGSLTEVTIPDSVESIDQFAFGMCGSLTTVNFQGTVPPKLGKGIFDDDDDLTVTYIPSCQYLEAYQAAEGWSTYQEKLTASDHDGFTYTAASTAVTQRCACGSVSAIATLSIREGANLDYTGSAITPVQITYSDNWVELGDNKPDDTSIVYENNINPGTATAELTIGGATAQISFTIVPPSYHVTLHTNGGDGGTDLTSYTYGTGAVLPTNWKKTGYIFSGWYDNENFTGTAVTNISGTDTGDKEYWAKWTDNIALVIGTITYNYQPKNLWHWLIGKDSLIITVPVTEEGSGADEITYTVTPDGGMGKVETAAIENGKATITVSADFKGTVSVVCTDRAGNTSAGVTVGASLSATGIIIEDHAPGITTDARTDYYDTPAAVNVTVKDDTGNAITAGIASVTYQVGNGTVIVMVVYEEEKCTAVVADTEKVVKAVLTPDQQELVNGGETIEIRIDVTDISGKVPAEDREVIESGIGAYRKEVPGLQLGMYVDISMFIRIGAEDWNAITETDEPIEVVVNIPEKLLSDGREFYIIRAHNGEYTFMNDMDEAPDTITVSTDLFSSYAIAYVETDGTGAGSGGKCGLCHICPTFLGICYFVWLADCS